MSLSAMELVFPDTASYETQHEGENMTTSHRFTLNFSHAILRLEDML